MVYVTTSPYCYFCCRPSLSTKEMRYMNEAKGELTNCLLNLCRSVEDDAVVLLVYANREAVRAHQNTPECTVNYLSKTDRSAGYNFKLGTLVDAVEYEVDAAVIDLVMAESGLCRKMRTSMLSLVGSTVQWAPSTGKAPLVDAMALCNLYVAEMWYAD